MKVNTMSQMWKLLDTYTMSAEGLERSVNQNNEWGGFSRKLNMPVFTGWIDHTEFDKATKTTTAIVSDEAWLNRPIGLKNQERWVRYAEEKNDGIAAFFVIHPKDKYAEIREVEYIDGDKVFIGKLHRKDGRVYLVGMPRLLS